MTKLLKFLSLTTILSTTSVLPLVQENNNQISTNQTNQTTVIIDNINKKMTATAEAGIDTDFKRQSVNDLTLNLSWAEAQTITTGVATNYFASSLSRGKKISNELHLVNREKTRPGHIMLSGGFIDIDLENNQLAYIFIAVHLHRYNIYTTKASVVIFTTAETFGAFEGCSASYFIDKISLF